MRGRTLLVAFVLSVELSARQPVHARHGNQGVADVEAIVVDKDWLTGGMDGRGGGKVAGY